MLKPGSQKLRFPVSIPKAVCLIFSVSRTKTFFAVTGETKSEDFLSSSKREEEKKMIAEHPDQSAYTTLANVLTVTEYQFFLSWLRLQSKLETE